MEEKPEVYKIREMEGSESRPRENRKKLQATTAQWTKNLSVTAFLKRTRRKVNYPLAQFFTGHTTTRLKIEPNMLTWCPDGKNNGLVARLLKMGEGWLDKQVSPPQKEKTGHVDSGQIWSGR